MIALTAVQAVVFKRGRHRLRRAENEMKMPSTYTLSYGLKCFRFLIIMVGKILTCYISFLIFVKLVTFFIVFVFLIILILLTLSPTFEFCFRFFTQ